MTLIMMNQETSVTTVLEPYSDSSFSVGSKCADLIVADCRGMMVLGQQECPKKTGPMFH